MSLARGRKAHLFGSIFILKMRGISATWFSFVSAHPSWLNSDCFLLFKIINNKDVSMWWFFFFFIAWKNDFGVGTPSRSSQSGVLRFSTSPVNKFRKLDRPRVTAPTTWKAS